MNKITVFLRNSVRRFFSVWTIFYIFNILRFGQDIDSSTLLINISEINKCPFCYGISICSLINDNKIIINYYSFFDQLLNRKNIFHGTLNNNKIVAKKLASNDELINFDQNVENYRHLFLNNSNNFSKINIDALYHNIINETTLSFTDENIKLRVCPETANFEQFFIKKFVEKWSNNSLTLIHLWTIIKINPEPFLLSILTLENGWPAPKFYGSCGRIAVIENVGLTLDAFYNESWLRRAKIAISLLNSAHSFTFKDSNFAIYLTDISPDNIAVDDDFNVKFIDLENVVIFDRQFNYDTSRNIVHVSEILDNVNSFSFSVEKICEHKISDHNFYGICQILWQKSDMNIYGQNFLHNIPEDILEKYPALMDTIQQCFTPENNSDRIKTGMKLKSTLEHIMEHFL